jgi:DNA-directed RNA polymerase subunit K/omega
MSSYFDNQYGGEDEDNKFGGDSDAETSSTSETEAEEEELEVGAELEEEGLEEDVEDELEDDEDDDEDIEGDTQEGGAGEGEGDGEEDDEIEEEVEVAKKSKKTKKIPAKPTYKKPEFMDDDDDVEEDSEMYLQKFDQSINTNYVVDFHPESVLQNYDEILSMVKVIRDKDGIIIDDLHRTIPYLTKYERARILGQRAKQINSGATSFVKVPENVIDGYIIAELELKQKKVPFIIRRPLPNGGSEYWSIKDLEDISF